MSSSEGEMKGEIRKGNVKKHETFVGHIAVLVSESVLPLSPTSTACVPVRIIIFTAGHKLIGFQRRIRISEQ